MTVLASAILTVTRAEAHFDRACDEAHRQAVSFFGIDDDGHSSRLPNWERFDSAIELTFKGYTRIGSEHAYRFCASAVKNDEE